MKAAEQLGQILIRHTAAVVSNTNISRLFAVLNNNLNASVIVCMLAGVFYYICYSLVHPFFVYTKQTVARHFIILFRKHHTKLADNFICKLQHTFRLKVHSIAVALDFFKADNLVDKLLCFFDKCKLLLGIFAF